MFNLLAASSYSNRCTQTGDSVLFAQVERVDQLLIAIGFRFAQIIEQTSALRDHLKQAAARRMIFPVSLEVLRQMLDPAGQKCDLHICAARIFIVQLELLKTFGALCHNEGATLVEEPVLATAQLFGSCRVGAINKQLLFAFAVVPKAELCTRTDSAGTADDYAKEFAQKMFRRIHAQFPT